MRDISKTIRVAVVDDHTLFRNALARLIDTFEGFYVLFESENGDELKCKLRRNFIPDIILLDVNMPVMNGFETSEWLYKNYPQIKVLALSMFNDDNTIIRMLKAGAKGYIMKTAEPNELFLALRSVVQKNFYLSEHISGKIVGGLNKNIEIRDESVRLTDKELEFLKLSCSELSYKEIGEKMFVGTRRVEDHRNSLFEKLKMRSRVGLVIYAIKNGIFKP